MKRPLAVTSAGLVLLGLELSTQAISTVLGRLRSGVGALLSGTESFVPRAQLATGMALIALGLAMAGILVWASVQSRRIETVGGLCPRCGDETRRVRRSVGQRVLSQLLRGRVTRRRCERCGWNGVAISG